MNVTSKFFRFSVMLLAALGFAACESDLSTPGISDESTLNFRSDVDPVVAEDWQSGNASFESEQAGGCGDFALKIDNWDGVEEDGDYSDPLGEPATAAANVITISQSNAQTFAWISEYEVCAVIVKGGPDAHIYYYPEGSCGDEGLYAPVNPNNGQHYDISHVTFAWTDTPCDGETNACYQEETAWADGERYTNQGSWATYTPYPGDGGTVDIYAGRDMPAGTATFTDNGDGTVEISIDLVDGFIFYYDLGNPEDDSENLKVQDYESAPSGNPAIGLFDHKASVNVGATSATIIVPANNYYGIHLDVAHEVPCE